MFENVEKRKTRLGAIKSIAQWTMGTFSVDAKDAGRLAGSQIAPVTLESATTRLGTRQTQHSRRANSIRSEF